MKTWLLKVLGIFLFIVSIFLFTTRLQAATPTPWNFPSGFQPYYGMVDILGVIKDKGGY